MITLHHLAYSRATRVLCALEELGIAYRLERYDRTGTMRAPPALAQVHPLGKSPVIVDDGQVIGESSVILQYLNERYGNGRLTPAKATPERLEHDEWLEFVESTAAFPIMIMTIGRLRNILSDGMRDFAAPNVTKILDNIATGVGDGPFIMGDAFTLADIQMSYILAMAEAAGLLEDHPSVGAYLARIQAYPSFARALEIGGPMVPPKRNS